MENQKTQIVEKLKGATNILVTVSSNPSVDQLSAAIGLTLFLNHLGKHTSAVFSGQVPSTIEFLQPEKTLEKTTDSLRDFIIALDKSKADKLRYKVEDQMVKIFITPYQTSITDKDLEFSHGDFNVDVVFALGVNEQADLDQAITAHGRILHDATVVSVGVEETPSTLGSINWNDAKASSLCEMVTSLATSIKPEAFDSQMATALLTGIVAQTERFSNEKTSSETMQLSAKLMAAGANQQLVASQLQQPETPAVSDESSDDKPNEEVTAELPEPKDDGGSDASANEPEKPEEKASKTGSDGSLQIQHGDILPFSDDAESEKSDLEQIHIDEDGTIKTQDEIKQDTSDKEKVIEPPAQTETAAAPTPPRIILEPPTLSAKLPSADETPNQAVSINPLSGPTPAATPLLNHDTASALTPSTPLQNPNPAPEGTVIQPTAQPSTPAAVTPASAPADDSITELEKAVESIVSSDATPSTDLDAARQAVDQAATNTTPVTIEPAQALNAQPTTSPEPSVAPATPNVSPPLPEVTPPALSNPTHSLIPPDPGLPADKTAASVTDPTAPPPVPPPMMPPIITPANPPADNTPGSVAL